MIWRASSSAAFWPSTSAARRAISARTSDTDSSSGDVLSASLAIAPSRASAISASRSSSWYMPATSAATAARAAVRSSTAPSRASTAPTLSASSPTRLPVDPLASAESARRSSTACTRSATARIRS